MVVFYPAGPGPVFSLQSSIHLLALHSVRNIPFSFPLWYIFGKLVITP